MKKITMMMAMLALMMFSAVPAFAYEIEVEEGDVTITDTLTIEDSIVQSCGASVVFDDENENVQLISNSQNVVIGIDGDGNEVEVEQSLEQSGFSPEVSTDCTQSVAQAFSF
jgi:translation initiation factor IF-2